MIVVLKKDCTPSQRQTVVRAMEAGGVTVVTAEGEAQTILVAAGPVSALDEGRLSQLAGVSQVLRVTKPFRKSDRLHHPENTVVTVGQGLSVGGNRLAVIAGPCAVESAAQIGTIAAAVKAAGAIALRGGAFKPRTSPYAFQGLGEEGLRLLRTAGADHGLPVVTEILSADQLPLFEETADVLQVGARNMQNYELLKALGKSQKPILLKRGLSATIEEWLLSAEYLLDGGNENVILCERGIRTPEPYTRNTLDLSAVALVKELSHLPVLVDPSHACGRASLVEPMSLAAIAAGADGLLIEVHNDPEQAVSDGAQSLTPEQFAQLMEKLSRLAPCVGRSL
ncbi:MAG: 3-deoxy-7-phosphoheptulonate synthase [Oscillospiraceae bacterium]